MWTFHQTSIEEPPPLYLISSLQLGVELTENLLQLFTDHVCQNVETTPKHTDRKNETLVSWRDVRTLRIFSGEVKFKHRRKDSAGKQENQLHAGQQQKKKAFIYSKYAQPDFKDAKLCDEGVKWSETTALFKLSSIFNAQLSTRLNKKTFCSILYLIVF